MVESRIAFKVRIAACSRHTRRGRGPFLYFEWQEARLMQAPDAVSAESLQLTKGLVGVPQSELRFETSRLMALRVIKNLQRCNVELAR